MSYIRAEEVLPAEVLAVIQEYVDGQMLYIPRKPEHKKMWGACTATKKSLELRNSHICTKFQKGTSVKEPAAIIEIIVLTVCPVSMLTMNRETEPVTAAVIWMPLPFGSGKMENGRLSTDAGSAVP